MWNVRLKKHGVRLRITPCCSTVVQDCAPYVPPLCAHDDLNSAVYVLLSDDSEVTWTQCWRLWLLQHKYILGTYRYENWCFIYWYILVYTGIYLYSSVHPFSSSSSWFQMPAHCRIVLELERIFLHKDCTTVYNAEPELKIPLEAKRNETLEQMIANKVLILSAASATPWQVSLRKSLPVGCRVWVTVTQRHGPLHGQIKFLLWHFYMLLYQCHNSVIMG